MIEPRHTKVGDLDDFVGAGDGVEEDVFRFEVSMANVEAMAVVDAGNDLLEDGHDFEEGEAAAMGTEVIE